MPGWLEYALTEISRALSLKRQTGSSADFLWMGSLLILLISIVATSAAMNRSLINNFADSLLGFERGAGVPVRILFDSSISTPKEKAKAAALFRNSASIGGSENPDPASPVAGYEFHPFAEIEAGYIFNLPESAWKGDSIGTAFSGWAVSSGSPLWRGLGLASVKGENTIVLSRTAFSNSFDSKAYSEDLETLVGGPRYAGWMKRNPSAEEQDSIYLQVPFAPGRSRYHEFDVVWVESFPSVQRIAFLVSMELFVPLQNAARDGLYTYWPGRRLDNNEELVSRLDLLDIDKLAATERMEVEARVLACVGSSSSVDVERASYDTFFRFDVPVERSIVQQCAESLGGLDFSVYSHAPSTPALSIRNDKLFLSCERVDERMAASREELEGCLSGAPEVSVELLQAFSSGFAYVPAREALSEFVDSVEKTFVGERRALYISELYRNSIQRFLYLVETLNYIKIPAAIFFFIISFYTILTNISMFFSHRVRNYGVLIARGMSVAEIKRIIYVQFGVFFAFAAMVSFAILLGIKYLLQVTFLGSSSFNIATRELGIQVPRIVEAPGFTQLFPFEVLSRTFEDTFIGAIVIGLILFCITLYKLRKIPLRSDTYPLDLLVAS